MHHPCNCLDARGSYNIYAELSKEKREISKILLKHFNIQYKYAHHYMNFYFVIVLSAGQLDEIIE